MWRAGSGALALALLAAPAAAQECIGRGLLRGGGAWAVTGALVEGEPAVGVDAAAVPPGPWSWLGTAELAVPGGGWAVHLGGRTLLETGAGPCVSAGLSYYHSASDAIEPYPSVRFQIVAPSLGIALGKAIPSGRWILNPFASAEGHLIFKAQRGSDGWSGWSNEGRAVVAAGLGGQRGSFFLKAALLLYPGTASILEASRGTIEAGGNHAGFEVGIGRTF